MQANGFSKFWIRVKNEPPKKSDGEGPDQPGGDEEDNNEGGQNRKADPEKKGGGRAKADHGHHDKGEPQGGGDAKGDGGDAEEPGGDPKKKKRHQHPVEVIRFGIKPRGRGSRRKPRGRGNSFDWLNWHHRTRR